jgi:ABC-2 type transport system permease protein
VFLLGGLLIPLELLPDGIGNVAKVLPWASMTWVPGRLASGDVDPLLIGLQLAWLLVAGVLALGVFALGERRLQVVGG